MHKIFGLKPICIIEGVCKCVVPIKNMDSYVSKLATLDLGFVIYNKEGFNVNEIFSYEGSKTYENIEMSCEKCWYYTKRICKDITNQVSIWEKRFGIKMS